MGDAVHMRVHRDAVHDAKGDVKDDVGGLATHTRKLDQLFHIRRHLAAVIRDDHLRRLHAVLGLGFVEPQRLDDLGHLRRGSTGHGLRCGPALKECRRHLVHLGIRCLGGQQNGDNQAERTRMVQKALDGAVALVQAPARLDGALALCCIGFTRHVFLLSWPLYCGCFHANHRSSPRADSWSKSATGPKAPSSIPSRVAASS